MHRAGEGDQHAEALGAGGAGHHDGVEQVRRAVGAERGRVPHGACEDDRRRLLYFARGFEFLQREIGFTPGRTIALAGCLLAWEEGWLVEVAEMFDLLQRMAAGPWRPYLEYSGGSRLDQEFLIKIKPGLVPILEKELQ